MQVGSISFNSTSGASAQITLVSCVNHLAIDGIPAMHVVDGKCERIGNGLVTNLVEYVPTSVSASIVDLDADVERDNNGKITEWKQGTTHNYQITLAVTLSYATKLMFAPARQDWHKGSYIDSGYIVESREKRIRKGIALTDWNGSPAKDIAYGCAEDVDLGGSIGTKSLYIPMQSSGSSKWTISGDAHEKMFDATVLYPWQV